jgi:NifU-like protein
LLDRITEVKYLTFGCTSAIAASEALCILLETGNYTPIKALSLTKNHIVTFLEGLPTQKIHCSIMGVEAMHLAVKDWAEKRGVDLKKLGINIVTEDDNKSTDDSPVVCRCLGLRKDFLYKEIKRLALKTVDEVTDVLKAGSVCGSCKYEPGGVQDIINEVNESQARETTSKKTPFQIAKQIEEVVNKEIEPALSKDGGGIEIVEIRGNILYFRLKGSCSHCVSADNTIKYTIEQTLKDKVDQNVKVISVD